jgi:hypothetical protein
MALNRYQTLVDEDVEELVETVNLWLRDNRAKRLVQIVPRQTGGYVAVVDTE